MDPGFSSITPLPDSKRLSSFDQIRRIASYKGPYLYSSLQSFSFTVSIHYNLSLSCQNSAKMKGQSEPLQIFLLTAVFKRRCRAVQITRKTCGKQENRFKFWYTFRCRHSGHRCRLAAGSVTLPVSPVGLAVSPFSPMLFAVLFERPWPAASSPGAGVDAAARSLLVKRLIFLRHNVKDRWSRRSPR